MSRIRILPYGASNSARDLSQALRGKRLRLEGSSFQQRPTDHIINWGKAGSVNGIQPTMNSYNAVNRAGNKLLAFRDMQQAGVSIPDFTTDRNEAQSWLDAGEKVVERHALRGHSGEGIRIVEGGSLEDAPLYVKYIPKQEEYRVHVMSNTIIDVQQKRRRRETPDNDVNWQVRNLDGGFIFARENVEVPQQVLQEAVQAVQALGLDFGAVDLVFNVNRGTGYVLEVNTACGLSGTTLNSYVSAFRHVFTGESPDAWTGTVTNPEPRNREARARRRAGQPEPAPQAAPVLFAGTPYEGQTVEQLTSRLGSLLDEADIIDNLLQGA